MTQQQLRTTILRRQLMGIQMKQNLWSGMFGLLIAICGVYLTFTDANFFFPKAHGGLIDFRVKPLDSVHVSPV